MTSLLGRSALVLTFLDTPAATHLSLVSRLHLMRARLVLPHDVTQCELKMLSAPLAVA